MSSPLVLLVSWGVLATSLLSGSTGLVIKDLRVPNVVVNGSADAVVLDCDYLLDDDIAGLVVKWYFNNNPQPVYQWIQDKKPQDLGVLKGKLNLDYRASDDALTMYRALQIMNPTTELSGDYRCQVSTFNQEKSLTKRMVVFVPAKSLKVTQTKQNENSAVNVTCTAERVFPEPKLAISETRSGLANDAEVLVTPRNGAYDIIATVVMEDKNLESPTTFDCELKIPEANYSLKMTSIYYPGSPTTTTPEPPTTSTEFVPDANLIVDNSSSTRMVLAWLLLASVVLCLRL